MQSLCFVDEQTQEGGKFNAKWSGLHDVMMWRMLWCHLWSVSNHTYHHLIQGKLPRWVAHHLLEYGRYRVKSSVHKGPFMFLFQPLPLFSGMLSRLTLRKRIYLGDGFGSVVHDVAFIFFLLNPFPASAPFFRYAR